MSTSPENSPQSLYQKSSERDIVPIILDPSQSPISTSGFEEQTSQGVGFLANNSLSVALLSMSNYGKSFTESEDYVTTNPSSMYLAYTSQSISPPHLQGSYSRDSDSTYPSYDARTITQSPSSGWTSESTQIPEVVNWSPKVGAQGTTVTVTLRSSFAIDTSMMNLYIKFGSAKSPRLTLTPLEADGTHYQYALYTEAPTYIATGWISYDVPVVVVADDQSGNVMASVKLEGSFAYTSTIPPLKTPIQTSSSISRKRRLSDSQDDSAMVPTKRLATMPPQTSSINRSDSYRYEPPSGTYITASPPMAVVTPMSTYNRPGEVRYVSPPRVQPTLGSYSGVHFKHEPTHNRSWSTSNLGSVLSKSPNMSNTARRVNTMASVSPRSNPKLVRTSQISQSPSPASTPQAPTTVGSYNPYNMYPHKAQLKVSGDLDSVLQGWTHEERDAKRRLVQFWRSQTGSTITASFAPVAPEDRQPNAICVSCIWWEEKDQYFITSVDTIFLLESLVAVRFTVEEKNRIRRNLEGFRPSTVSKGKSDSEEFFKLIMGFPNPKPRNIEKDVKVYSWKVLNLALKKIIGKYSASYSAMPSNAGSSVHPYHSVAEMSSSITSASPQTTAESALSMSYQSPLVTASMPASMHNQSSLSSAYTSSSMLPSTITSSYSLYPYSQTQPSHSSSLLSYSTSGQPPHTSHNPSHSAASSWDSGISMQPQVPVSSQGMYSFGSSSHHGLDQYQISHSHSG